MKPNGALKPHGAPVFGRSIGARKYRDKRPKQQQQQQQLKRKNSQHFNNQSNNNIATLTTNKNILKCTLGFNPLDDNSEILEETNSKPKEKNIKMGRCVRRAPRNAVAFNCAGKGKILAAIGTDDHVTFRQTRVRESVSFVKGFDNFSVIILGLLFAFILLPYHVICDEDNSFFVNSFSMGLETTTPEFDYATRGKKKFGDKCENTLECGFPGSICDPKKKSCQCVEELPVTNHIDKCGKESAVNESCFFNEQCESFNFQTECRDGRCVCRFEMTPILSKDGVFECKAGNKDKRTHETYIDPAMIGVLVGMALMFVIICVVLRLFSQARWRENRTIFNTPNPRLMNVSLLRDSKLLHGQERRGSRMSVRAPSRQPSMASLRPHSPNPSLGKIGSRSGSGSNSASSVRSTRSNSVVPGAINHERKGSSLHHQHQTQQQPLITNITTNPVAESVTVEIVETEK